jgi:beta-galactosidase
MSQAVPRHQRPTHLKQFLFGVPYYPEHWTDKERNTDPQRMAEAGVNVVRMAEFAWDRMEPAAGKLDFSLFDQTIARLGAVGIDTILCTPTAAPPAWMTAGRESWFRVDAAGKRMEHGSRQHVCTNNEEFRAESRRITAAMAKHYAGNERVIGWQTDNEFYCHMSECYCPSCRAGFGAWLKAKYGDIAALNEAWGTAFWALTYDSFDQIRLPDPNPRPANANPTAELDYYRYISDSIIEFQKQQVKILHAAKPAWWITHNGLFGHIDYWKFTEDLDFLAVDVYPGFTKTRDPQELFWASYINQRCRASSGGYIVPEQEAGAGADAAVGLAEHRQRGRWRAPLPLANLPLRRGGVLARRARPRQCAAPSLRRTGPGRRGTEEAGAENPAYGAGCAGRGADRDGPDRRPQDDVPHPALAG